MIFRAHGREFEFTTAEQWVLDLPTGAIITIGTSVFERIDGAWWRDFIRCDDDLLQCRHPTPTQAILNAVHFGAPVKLLHLPHP